jgi:endoglucanase
VYPGDAYVDWTCLDGYNWGSNPAGNLGGWQTFDQVYHSTYHDIVDTLAPTKPMIIGEMASTEYGGSFRNKGRFSGGVQEYT